MKRNGDFTFFHVFNPRVNFQGRQKNSAGQTPLQCLECWAASPGFFSGMIHDSFLDINNLNSASC